MMDLNDPNTQKGIWITVVTFISGIAYWIKRRIGLVDTLAEKVAKLEKNKVDYDHLEHRMEVINQSLREGHREISNSVKDVHKRVDQIYRDMPKREGNHMGEE